MSRRGASDSTREEIRVMSLRLPAGLHEALRQEAFDKRVSMNSLVVAALIVPGVSGIGCDVCGKPHVMVSTPGAIRFCADHRPLAGDAS